MQLGGVLAAICFALAFIFHIIAMLALMSSVAGRTLHFFLVSTYMRIMSVGSAVAVLYLAGLVVFAAVGAQDELVHKTVGFSLVFMILAVLAVMVGVCVLWRCCC